MSTKLIENVLSNWRDVMATRTMEPKGGYGQPMSGQINIEKIELAENIDHNHKRMSGMIGEISHMYYSIPLN